MTSLLGLPLDLARERLLRAGVSVECREVCCRKGSPGSDLRVVAQREEQGKILLLYAGFRTTIEH